MHSSVKIDKLAIHEWVVVWVETPTKNYCYINDIPKIISGCPMFNFRAALSYPFTLYTFHLRQFIYEWSFKTKEQATALILK